MRVVTLVPRRNGDQVRNQVWSFISKEWQLNHPDYELIEGHHEGGLFNRSLAINGAADQVDDWDVAIILDADVICDPRTVRSAVTLAHESNSLVIAGDKRIHLSQRGSQRIMQGFKGDWEQRGFVVATYHEHWSSCVVVSRELWDATGGFDPGFEGWGYEDDAFRIACETMSETPMIRISGTIWHLWHPTRHDTQAQRKNKERADCYWAARWNKEAVQALRSQMVTLPAMPATRIPRLLHRTIPAQVAPEVELFWTRFGELHPGWDLRTYQEPLNPREWPITARYWPRCKNGAQKAGLIRLEALVRHGGIYVDSDVEPVRCLEPLLQLQAFAGWEDETTVPDAVLGAEPNHPAFKKMLEMACHAVQRGQDAWKSGPGVSTAVLPGRDDVLVLPPGALFPFHYHRKDEKDINVGPWTFVQHHWQGSWLNSQQQKSIAAGQRAAR